MGSHCLNPSQCPPGHVICLLVLPQPHLTAFNTLLPLPRMFSLGPWPRVESVPDMLLHSTLCFPLSAQLGSGRARILRRHRLTAMAQAQLGVGTQLLRALTDLECQVWWGRGSMQAGTQQGPLLCSTLRVFSRPLSPPQPNRMRLYHHLHGCHLVPTCLWAPVPTSSWIPLHWLL